MHCIMKLFIHDGLRYIVQAALLLLPLVYAQADVMMNIMRQNHLKVIKMAGRMVS